MQEYKHSHHHHNCYGEQFHNEHECVAGQIYSGEELYIGGRLRNRKGEPISFKDCELLQVIIRNMNGVVFFEYSTQPINEKQRAIEVRDNLFRAKLTSEQTRFMRGMYVMETKLKIGGYTFIDVTNPFEVLDDFVKRTKETEEDE